MPKFKKFSPKLQGKIPSLFTDNYFSSSQVADLLHVKHQRIIFLYGSCRLKGFRVANRFFFERKYIERVALKMKREV